MDPFGIWPQRGAFENLGSRGNDPNPELRARVYNLETSTGGGSHFQRYPGVGRGA